MAITADGIAGKVGLERGKIYIDTIGIGAGMPALLRDRGIEHVVGSKASHKANYPHVNARAYWAFKVRDLFIKGLISIPNNQKLIDQLSDIKYITRPDGSLLIERKEDIKARTGESPDLADALFISYSGDGVLDVDVPPEAVEPTPESLWKKQLKEMANEDYSDEALV